MWPEAVDVAKTHKSYVLVAVWAYGLPLVEAGKLHVKMVATCLKQPNAISVYVSGTVFQPKFYIKVVFMMEDDEDILPVLVWMYLGLSRAKRGIPCTCVG